MTNKIKKYFGRTVAGLSLIGILAGCSIPIESGQVLEKRYEPQREYTEKGTRFFGKVLTLYTREMIDDEDFIITFGKRENDKYQTRQVYVDKTVYDSLKIGDNFDTTTFPFEDSDWDRTK